MSSITCSPSFVSSAERRFVEQNELRFVHQRSTDRDPLAFAAGELGREMAPR